MSPYYLRAIQRRNALSYDPQYDDGDDCCPECGSTNMYESWDEDGTRMYCQDCKDREEAENEAKDKAWLEWWKKLTPEERREHKRKQDEEMIERYTALAEKSKAMMRAKGFRV